MHYGHPPHVASPDDLTILCCSCGWRSMELTLDDLRELGAPLYCGGMCGQQGLRYVRFHPREREQALACL